MVDDRDAPPPSDPPPSRGEALVRVDAANGVLGPIARAEAHAGDGVLHRAFSVFLFDGEGRVLLQQRSARKALWPLFWSNSVCSHPRPGEDERRAAERRVEEELGIATRLEFVYRFVYRARYEDVGSEHENCGVYLGRIEGGIDPDPEEVAACRWLGAAALDAAIAERPGTFTPWLRLEWTRLRGEFREKLADWLGE